jgi:vitamin B12 transporter
MITTRFQRSLLALALSSPCLTFGQTPASLDPIIVTASRIVQLESETLGDVSVIPREKLRKAGQQSLAEILAQEPGISFYNSGGPQSTTGLFLRGNDASHTLVLIDGVRINSSNYGGVNWNAIDPATIERIEVVRGAASSLYGSDAIGGVVNIITRKPAENEPLQAYANAGYGSHSTFKSGAGFSGAANGWNYNLSAAAARSSGFDATHSYASNAYPDNDGYRQNSIAGALGYAWKQGQRFDLSLYNGYINGDFDAGQLHPAISQTRQQAYTLSSTNQLTDFWESVLRFGYAKEDGISYSGNFAPYKFGSLTRTYTWQNNLALNPNQNLSILLERIEERPSGSMTFLSNRRNTQAAGLVYLGQFGRHRVQASIRNDHISDYGNHATGGLAYELALDDAWQVGLAANTGFQAPSFNDLYAPGWGGFPPQSNPDLKPEKSRNVEAHIRYYQDGLELGLVAYQNKVDNLIVSTPSRLENVDSATLRGITVTAAYQWDRTRLGASADFLNPYDNSTGERLIRRARHTYRLNAEHRIERWTLGAEFLYVGQRYDEAYLQGRVHLGGYSLWNLTAGATLTEALSLQVRWNNITNKDYTNVYGYANPGSTVFVNLAWKM